MMQRFPSLRSLLHHAFITSHVHKVLAYPILRFPRLLMPFLFFYIMNAFFSPFGKISAHCQHSSKAAVLMIHFYLYHSFMLSLPFFYINNSLILFYLAKYLPFGFSTPSPCPRFFTFLAVFLFSSA